MVDDPFPDLRARLARLHVAEIRFRAAWEAARGDDCPYVLLAEQHELAEARRVVLETAAGDLERVLAALDAARELLAEILAEFYCLDEERGKWHAPGLVDRETWERWREAGCE